MTRAMDWMAMVTAMALMAPARTEAAAPPGRYALSTDTVLDTKTNLTWQRAVPTLGYTWANAKSYCQGLALGGLTGWRLPTIRELQSLRDVRATNPTIDTVAFPATPLSAFWSSSPYAHNSSLALVVYFSNGNTGVSSVTGGGLVRCVR